MYFGSIHSSSSSPAPCGWTSRPRERRALGGWIGVLVGEHATPAERVDDQRRRQIPAVGVNGVAVAAADRGRLELGVARVGLLPQQRAQLAVVEGGERPRQLPARRGPRRVHDELVEGLAQRARRDRALPASRWGSRTPRSGARRSHSGRSRARALPCRPARARWRARRRRRRRRARRNRAAGECASAPRFVALTGIRRPMICTPPIPMDSALSGAGSLPWAASLR